MTMLMLELFFSKPTNIENDETLTISPKYDNGTDVDIGHVALFGVQRLQNAKSYLKNNKPADLANDIVGNSSASRTVS